MHSFNDIITLFPRSTLNYIIVGWHWPLTSPIAEACSDPVRTVSVKNGLPYNLYCVGGDVKPLDSFTVDMNLFSAVCVWIDSSQLYRVVSFFVTFLSYSPHLSAVSFSHLLLQFAVGRRNELKFMLVQILCWLFPAFCFIIGKATCCMSGMQ